MARRQENMIVRILDPVLRDKGFSRTKKTWYLARPETVLLVDLQKSEFSKKYYVNLGVSVLRLSTDPRPKINKCPISHRLEMLVQEHERPSAEQAPLPRSHAENNTFVHQITTNPLAPIVVPPMDPTFLDTKGLHIPKIFKALDLEDDAITDAERENTISDAMIRYGFPFLFDFESLDKIERTIREKDLSRVCLWRVVRDLFAEKDAHGGVKQ
jgi:Domain of unknown function (DUF4304)